MAGRQIPVEMVEKDLWRAMWLSKKWLMIEVIGRENDGRKWIEGKREREGKR